MSPPSPVASEEAPRLWLDAVAFVAGLGLAWWQGWQTADLVWSLWLSSLVVGYAMIVWQIAGPAFVVLPRIWQGRALTADTPLRAGAGLVLLMGGGLFMLAFFTVHFGGFHFVHSVFLGSFFPVKPGPGFPGLDTYTEVFSRYWLWLPVAFLAERAGFAAPTKTQPPDLAVTPEAIARRKAGAMNAGMMRPYQNVIRMHLLIFFFAGAHFLKIGNIIVYAVVYAVYFTPWGALRRRSQTKP